MAETVTRTRPLKYLVAGAWNTAFGYAAYAAFYRIFQVFGLNYLWATVPAQLLAVANAFVSQRFFVFGRETRVVTSFLRFSLVYWALYCVNVPLLALFVSGFGMHPLLAQAILTAVTAAVGYFAHSRFTFRVASGRSP